jgi:hypothetical protein
MRVERDVGKLRRWCIRWLLEGWSIRDVSVHAMTPKSTVHQWNGWVGLVDKSRRPHIIHRLPQETVVRIIEVRLREGWCSEAITAYLNQQENIKVSRLSVQSPQRKQPDHQNLQALKRTNLHPLRLRGVLPKIQRPRLFQRSLQPQAT